MLANNEIGTIQPIAQLAAIAHAHGAWFHTDAVQAVGHIPVDVKALGVDMLSLSGHKFHAPKGVGALYVKKGVLPDIFMDGGGQEKGRRAGTENLASIVGLGEAITRANENMAENLARVTKMRERLIDELLKLPKTRLNGSQPHPPSARQRQHFLRGHRGRIAAAAAGYGRHLCLLRLGLLQRLPGPQPCPYGHRPPA